MIEHGYHYALAFCRLDGSSVGQVAVTVDWEPACECVRFEAHGADAKGTADIPQGIGSFPQSLPPADGSP